MEAVELKTVWNKFFWFWNSLKCIADHSTLLDIMLKTWYKLLPSLRSSMSLQVDSLLSMPILQITSRILTANKVSLDISMALKFVVFELGQDWILWLNAQFICSACKQLMMACFLIRQFIWEAENCEYVSWSIRSRAQCCKSMGPHRTPTISF